MVDCEQKQSIVSSAIGCTLHKEADTKSELTFESTHGGVEDHLMPSGRQDPIVVDEAGSIPWDDNAFIFEHHGQTLM